MQSFINNDVQSIALLNTDRIILNILNEDLGIDTIFKIIDDITEYLNGEIGLVSKDDFLLVYDENNTTIDRYAQFF